MSAQVSQGGPVLPVHAMPAHWRAPLLAVFMLWAWILLMLRDTAVSMVEIWSRSETFTHGFFVAPIALWLMWRQRASLWALQPRPMPWVLLLMALCAGAWLLADLVSANAPAQFALVALLALSVPCLLGPQVTRVLLFPLGFLFFAVPMGEFMLEPLMEGTATFTVMALRATGIPVYREGLQFVIPSGAWSVVEACSGVRYLIASLTVGTLYAHLNYRTARRRWLFIGVAILVPIVANWMRAYLIVLLGHLTSNRLGAGVDHLIYGWVFFGVVILLMFMIGGRWADADGPPIPSLHNPLAQGTASHRFAVTAVLAALLVVLPTWVGHRMELGQDVKGPDLSAPEALSEGWARLPEAPADWAPGFQNPSSELNAGYGHDGREVGLYIGYYRNQHAGRKLVSSSNTLTRGSKPGWVRVEAGARIVRLEAPLSDVRATLLRNSAVAGDVMQRRVLVWQWYWIDGRWTSDDRMAKLYGAAQRLMGRADESAVVMVYAPQRDGAEAALRSFVQANQGRLQDLLQQAKAR